MLAKLLTTSVLCLAALACTKLFAEPAAIQKQLEAPLPTKPADIADEIQLLETVLQRYRSEASKEEIQAQPYMFDSWHRFAQGIEQHEEDEKYIQAIKERLQKLYEQKAAAEIPPQPR